MPEGNRPIERAEELAAVLRRTVARLEELRQHDLDPVARQRVERLLAEAEAALAELETPEEF